MLNLKIQKIAECAFFVHIQVDGVIVCERVVNTHDNLEIFERIEFILKGNHSALKYLIQLSENGK